MNTQLTDKVKFLQKAALIHQGKALILKRAENSTSRPGAWDLPGGNAEWPTSSQPLVDLHKTEIAREIMEETQIQIDPAQFADEALMLFTTYFEPQVQRYDFICGWAVDLPDNFDPGSVVISSEHTEWAWINLNELDAYDFGEPVGTFVKNIIRRALQRK